MSRKKTDEQIDYRAVALRAYELWKQRGSPHGGHDNDWYRAEQELRSAPKSANGSGDVKKDGAKKPKASKRVRSNLY